jgi:flavin reductase (DIM6/NTAB) family NADH-FMN oxidoreductase RutF
MEKIGFNLRTTAYPMPVSLVGSTVNGKPNFMAVAWFSKVSSNPPMMMVAIGKHKHTAQGITENNCFSVNIPGEDKVTETDYCGIVSGRNEDKARLFDVFYGKTNALMIRGCPINYELTLTDTIETPGNNLYIGEIVGAYVDEDKRSGETPDLTQAKPLILIESPPSHYHGLGHHVADAFQVGNRLKQSNTRAHTGSPDPT